MARVGALAFGIGTTEVAHVLATQTLWQRKPRTMRITLRRHARRRRHGQGRDPGAIGRFGAAGATGHVMEYAGSAIRGAVDGRRA